MTLQHQHQVLMQVLRGAATGPCHQVQADAYRALKEMIERLPIAKQSLMEFQLFKVTDRFVCLRPSTETFSS